MSHLIAILERAASLGLSGEAAQQLVVKEQELIQEKADREERLADRELKKVQFQADEAEKQRKHELQIAQLKKNDTSSNKKPYFEGLKLPKFDEGEDEFDSYLQRFERLAVIHQWKREDYHVYLGSCLRGRALKVYTSLPEDTVNDYAKLRDALLKAYTVDADSYRRKFKASKVQDKESHVQLIVRMRLYLERWLSMSKVNKDYDSLCDFLVMEHLLMNSSQDLRVFLKEHEYTNSQDMAEAADRYRGAHNYKEGKARGTSTKPASVRDKSDIRCHHCNQLGHIRPDCPDNPRNFKSNKSKSSDKPKPKFTEVKVNFVFDAELLPPNCTVDHEGRLCDKPASVVLDTACNGIIVNDKLVPSKFKVNSMAKVYDWLGCPTVHPRVRCKIQSVFFTGWVTAVAAPIKFADVLIGLIPGVKIPVECIEGIEPQINTKSIEICQAVQTRSAKLNSKSTALSCPEFLNLNVTKGDIAKEQQTCSSLKSVRDKVVSGDSVKSKSRSTNYQLIDGLIYRVCLDSQNKYEIGTKQLIVPEKYRVGVMGLAHDALTAGHFSHRKTSSKVFEHFFWPSAGADIKRFCRSCPKCQKFSARGSVRKVPMKNIPVISVPFARVAIDIVGAITPGSERGHKYILTLIDYATRYPEAVPLKNVDTVTVAEALVEIFSRVGIPKEIMSDRGSQFKSDLMSEVHRLLSVKALFTSPYHACCNGAVERLNGVLKSIIKKLCSDHPRDWDRYIPAALFAYREMPNDSLKFSPFELLYGRKVRGPLSILHELWSNDGTDNEVITTYQYVLDLRSRLEETAKLAASHAEISSQKYKEYYDLKARPRKLSIGDEVLVLLPTSSNKLVMQWRGPFPVIGCHDNGVDYIVKMQGKEKLFHINMLKKYFRRDSVKIKKQKPIVVQVCVEAEIPVNGTCEPIYFDVGGINVLNVCDNLTLDQNKEMLNLLKRFPDVLCDKPGLTSTLEHKINLTSTVPVHKKQYPIPHHLVVEFNKEVDKMLELGVIEPSESPYSSPVVLIKKPDGTWRVCIDFRALNSISYFDAEPMPTTDDSLNNFVNDVYFSELDLCKGYWQIPLSEECKVYTSFATHRGLMQWKVMPFGLKTACATFIRLMRTVLHGLSNTACYFDNIVIHNSDWTQHLLEVERVLSRLRKHGLTASPSKCFFGYPKIKYLGVILGHNYITPLEEKVKAINALPLPTTKKQLRSFLGTTDYYRKFVPHYASIAAPLSEFLRKHSKNKLDWKENQITSFKSLKDALMSHPILCLPDMSKTFYLRTDASDTGVGAVLLQVVNDCIMPIAYASRKLLDREVNYATIEKECLAIVWAVQKFRVYLYGKEFILQTDQKPLSYLFTMRNSNGRLMRWALALQCYSFSIEYIKGKDNVGADLLSRCPV